MTLLELWGYIRDGGMIALLLLILVGGHKGYWVWGWYATELRARIERLETALERATRAAERSADQADRATRRLVEPRGGGDA